MRGQSRMETYYRLELPLLFNSKGIISALKLDLYLRWPTLFFSENSVLENFLILIQCVVQLHNFREK